jgi:hypothetical protein
VRTAVSLLVLAVLLAPLAACGGGRSGRLSKSEYERTMQSIQPVVEAGLQSFRPTDFAHLAAYVARLGDEAASVARKLGAVRPPKDVEAPHDRLADGASRAARTFHGLAAELRGKSVAEVQEIVRRFDFAPLFAALAEMQHARETIAARGYRFSSSAGT